MDMQYASEEDHEKAVQVTEEMIAWLRQRTQSCDVAYGVLWGAIAYVSKNLAVSRNYKDAFKLFTYYEQTVRRALLEDMNKNDQQNNGNAH